MKQKIVILLSTMLFCFGTMQIQSEEMDGKEDYGSLAEFDYSSDYQYMFTANNSRGDQFITRAEDGYYLTLESLLYHVDEDLKEVTVLCDDPKCLHDGASTFRSRIQCEAFDGVYHSFNIAFNQGRLYTMTHTDLIKKLPYGLGKLYSLSLDMNDMEQIQLTKKAIYAHPIIHRGYYYYIRYQSGALRCVARCDMENREEEILLSIKADGIAGFRIYQDYLYVTLSIENRERDFVVNCSTGEVTEFPKIDAKMEDKILSYDVCIEGDHLLHKAVMTPGSETAEVWMTDLDGSNQRFAFYLEEAEWSMGSDGEFLYLDNFCTEAVANGTNAHVIRYYDRDTLEYLGEIELEEGVRPMFTVWGDEKYLFYLMWDTNAEDNLGYQRIMYVRKDELRSGQPKVHLLAEAKGYDENWYAEAEEMYR